MKKIISIILSFVMALSVSSGLSINAFAKIGSTVYQNDVWCYSFIDEGAVATTYFEHEEEVTVPDSFEGRTVVCIGDGCFYNKKNLKSVKIPETVTCISSYAFNECTALKHIDLPKNVKTIEGLAFFKSGLKEIVIPEKVEYIGVFAFLSCTELETVTMSNNIKSVREGLFSGCTALKDIYYSGTKEEWEELKIDPVNATVHFAQSSPNGNTQGSAEPEPESQNNDSNENENNNNNNNNDNTEINYPSLNEDTDLKNEPDDFQQEQPEQQDDSSLNQNVEIAGNTKTKTSTPAKNAAVIKPNSTKIKKLKKGKRKLRVTWKKVTGVTGYQVQLATNKKFTKNKKLVNVGKAKTTSKTVKKLKAKKKYYVRIRTYKKVGNKTYYSTWSKAKTVKTK